MTIDKPFLTKKIGRMKKTIADSESMQVELKELIPMSRTPQEETARKNELLRQQQTTANLKFELAELLKLLKAAG